jgi:DNA-binding winged helix-turn-helix (wHTH) protein/TolB-like protein
MQNKNQENLSDGNLSQAIFYRSDCLVIDPQSGNIESALAAVRLGPINMAVLQVLVARSGEVVSRNDIFDLVWKNQIVSDDTLTRCISDLRNSLKSLSDTPTFIETLPKRGYRWLPKVEILAKDQALSSPIETHSDAKLEIDQHLNDSKVIESASKMASLWPRIRVLNLFAFFVALVVLAAALNGTVSYFSKTKPIRVALLPVKIAENVDQGLAVQMEEILRSELLATKNLRFLSSNAVNIHPQTPYPYLAREFGTQWVIEGKISRRNNQLRILLNLVDANTALVFHRISREIDNDPGQIEEFCKAFLAEISPVLDSAS